jgi:hypothetical protein
MRWDCQEVTGRHRDADAPCGPRTTVGSGAAREPMPPHTWEPAVERHVFPRPGHSRRLMVPPPRQRQSGRFR